MRNKARVKRRTSHETNNIERIKFMISSTFDSNEFVRLNLDRPTHSLLLIQTDKKYEDRLWDKRRSFYESNLMNKSR